MIKYKMANRNEIKYSTINRLLLKCNPSSVVHLSLEKSSVSVVGDAVNLTRRNPFLCAMHLYWYDRNPFRNPQHPLPIVFLPPLNCRKSGDCAAIRYPKDPPGWSWKTYLGSGMGACVCIGETAANPSARSYPFARATIAAPWRGVLSLEVLMPPGGKFIKGHANFKPVPIVSTFQNRSVVWFGLLR